MQNFFPCHTCMLCVGGVYTNYCIECICGYSIAIFFTTFVINKTILHLFQLCLHKVIYLNQSPTFPSLFALSIGMEAHCICASIKVPKFFPPFPFDLNRDGDMMTGLVVFPYYPSVRFVNSGWLCHQTRFLHTQGTLILYPCSSTVPLRQFIWGMLRLW